MLEKKGKEVDSMKICVRPELNFNFCSEKTKSYNNFVKQERISEAILAHLANES